MRDIVFFFSSLALWLLIGIIVACVIRRIKNKILITLVTINIVIAIVISSIWFFEIAIDGISQVAGVFSFLAVSVVLTIGQYFVIKLLNR